MEDGKEIW
jgi:hypothetical protein